MPPRKRVARSQAGPSKPGPSRKVRKPPPIPKSTRFMRLLQGRELGLGISDKFPETAFRMKVQDFNRIRSHRFGNFNEMLHTTYFLRAGKNALIGAWYVQLRNIFTSVVAQLHYDLSKVVVGRTGYVVSSNTVVDACQASVNPDSFLCITSQANKLTGEIQIAIPTSREQELTTYKYGHPTDKPFWCCNSNFFTERFAVGCDREVLIYSLTGLQEIRCISDNIYALTYNKNGNLLHMGCETGEFISHDLRSLTTFIRMKPDNQILDDVLLLSNENQVIVSGVSGQLCKIDLRMRRKVLDFPSHNRRSRKIPVSVNEKYNLLGCTGADDFTRIWCLQTGELLKTFEAPSTYPARSCFVPNASRCQLHLIQDNFIHVYSMLR